MKEPGFPPRLSESSGDSRLADVLDVAKSYEPPDARMQRALAKFEATRTSRPDPVAGEGRPMFSTKVIAIAAIVLAIGAGWTVHRSAAEPSSPPSSTPGPTADTEMRPPSVTPRETITPSEAKTMRVEELPPAVASAVASTDKPAARPLPVPAATATATAPSFDDELALVEAARTSLAKGDGAGCLSQLDQYDRRIRGGVFEREVAVMRIEALLARGDSARARALGETFLAKNPESPYAARIRSLLGKLPAQPTRTP